METPILLKLFFLLAIVQADCQTFPCSAKYGACNNCTTLAYNGNQMITVALSRNICGGYTKQKCKEIFNGDGGLCTDGCNTCSCDANGLAQTKIGCGKYSPTACLTQHPNGTWNCGKLTCVCTKTGIGSYYSS